MSSVLLPEIATASSRGPDSTGRAARSLALRGPETCRGIDGLFACVEAEASRLDSVCGSLQTLFGADRANVPAMAVGAQRELTPRLSPADLAEISSRLAVSIVAAAEHEIARLLSPIDLEGVSLSLAACMGRDVLCVSHDGHMHGSTESQCIDIVAAGHRIGDSGELVFSSFAPSTDDCLLLVSSAVAQHVPPRELCNVTYSLGPGFAEQEAVDWIILLATNRGAGAASACLLRFVPREVVRNRQARAAGSADVNRPSLMVEAQPNGAEPKTEPEVAELEAEPEGAEPEGAELEADPGALPGQSQSHAGETSAEEDTQPAPGPGPSESVQPRRRSRFFWPILAVALLAVALLAVAVDVVVLGRSHFGASSRPAGRVQPTTTSAPAPARSWSFPTLSSPPDQTTVILNNPGSAEAIVHVTTGTSKLRVTVGAQGEAEMELEPGARTDSIRISSTVPIVVERIVVRHGTTSTSFGSHG